MTAGKTKTTTVRFDPERWQQLGTAAEHLGIAKARFIHDATIDRIVGVRTVEHLAGDTIDRLVRIRIGEMLRQTDRRVQHLEVQLAYRISGGHR